MANLSVVPSTVAPGTTVDVTGTGFDPKYKFALTTVDADGTEVGITTNTNRPRRDNSFAVGINVPPKVGPAKVRAYQRGVVVAEASLQIADAAPPPTVFPFLSRPARGPFVVDGGSDILVENVTILGGTRDTPKGIGITVRNATNVTIRGVDLANLVGGIYLYKCTGTLVIEYVRSRNIGDGTIGAGHSNHLQLAECRFTGAIRGNKFLGGRTEDMLSVWHSGGMGAGQELIIENNMLQGLVSDTPDARAWTSGSGTGIILSDGAGSPNNGNIICRRNSLLTPGQVGIQHIDGPNLQVYENTIYGEKRTGNNNPATSWEGNPRGTFRDNRYYWTKADGSHPDPWFGGGGSMVVTNNVADPAIDVAALRITL